MSKILIPLIDNKFYRNISITQIPNTSIVTQPIQQNIYGLYYRFKFNTVILPASLLDNSLFQFAIEYIDTVRVIVDVDVELPEDFISSYAKVFRFLIDSNLSKQYANNNTIIKSKYLINNQLYPSKKIPKADYIACFLDNHKVIPDQLLKVLYPQKFDYKIRMFNNHTIRHPQNLGLANELEKSTILQEAEYFLDINDGLYAVEAQLNGCKIIELKDLSNMVIKEPLTHQLSSYSSLIQDCIS